MSKNGFVMRFFGCAQRSVGVVGVQRSIQLSYDRTCFLGERRTMTCFPNTGKLYYSKGPGKKQSKIGGKIPKPHNPGGGGQKSGEKRTAERRLSAQKQEIQAYGRHQTKGIIERHRGGDAGGLQRDLLAGRGRPAAVRTQL